MSQEGLDRGLKLLSKQEKVLDAGGGLKLEEKEKEMKARFHDVDYTVIDIEENREPDVVGDICNMPFEDDSFDGVLCKEVMEHVYNPFKAVKEIQRVLKPGGVAVFTSPFLYPYHYDEGGEGADGIEERSTDEVKDYWRVTQDGWEYLLRDFDAVKIYSETNLVDVAFYFGTFTLIKPDQLKRFKHVFRKILGVFESTGNMIDNSTMGHTVIAHVES